MNTGVIFDYKDQEKNIYHNLIIVSSLSYKPNKMLGVKSKIQIRCDDDYKGNNSTSTSNTIQYNIKNYYCFKVKSGYSLD